MAICGEYACPKTPKSSANNCVVFMFLWDYVHNEHILFLEKEHQDHIWYMSL